MRITYLIGNGFDLGLGLKTGYKDFLNWYAAPGRLFADNTDVNVIKRNIASDIEAWGDMEIVPLGQKRDRH